MPLCDGTTDAIRLLPDDRDYQSLLWPFLIPYLVYVAISSIPEAVLPADPASIAKLLLTGTVLIYYRRCYRFGRFEPIHVIVALLMLPAALLSWIGPFYLLDGLGLADVTTTATADSFSAFYFYLRLTNSVLLVPIFEELFVRVYMMGWLYQAGEQRKGRGVFNAILETFEQQPSSVNGLPLSLFSVVGATIVFAAGHQTFEYPSAVSYFLLTTWLYKKSGSLWVCIVIHALTNLSIGLLARYGGMAWLW